MDSKLKMETKFDLSVCMKKWIHPIHKETKDIKEFIRLLKEPKSSIETMKKKFWKLYTPVFNEYSDAFELMRLIGVKQGLDIKYQQVKELAGKSLTEGGDNE